MINNKNNTNNGIGLSYLKATTPELRVRGITGTNLGSGYISGYEKNWQLTGKYWTEEASEMLMTDPIIKRSWNVLKHTLLSAKFIFKAGKAGDEISEELARFANECFGFGDYSGMMEINFESQLRYILEFLPLGWRYCEEVYYIAPDHLGRDKVWLKQYADREPLAHQKWLSRDYQNLDGVVQNMVNVQPEPIPANKLVLFTLDQTGSNFEGSGLLRPCWYYWQLKQRTSNLLAVATNRWAVPTPKVVVDRSVAEQNGYDDATLSQMIEDASYQAQAYLSQDQGYLVENNCVKFETYGDSSFSPDGALKVIQECDNQIASAFLSQFMNLGISDTGSRSVGEIHLSVFRRSCINFLDLVCSVISGCDRAGGGTIGRLIKWNYGEIENSKLPRLTHMGLDNDQLVDALSQLPALVSSNLITPDNQLERAIRQRIGAGDLPIEKSIENRQQGGNNGQSV